MKQIFSNEKIYTYAQLLHSNFIEGDSLILPIKVNFAIQKNLRILTEAAQDIENTRQDIAQKYGEYSSESDSYIVSPQNIPIAQKELNQLFEIEQSIDIMTIELDDLKDLQLTTKQMQALLFMINE